MPGLELARPGCRERLIVHVAAPREDDRPSEIPDLATDVAARGRCGRSLGAIRPNLAWAFGQTPVRLRQFIQPLPGLGTTGMRMNPRECTTVIAKFDLPKVPFRVRPSPRFPGENVAEYVWHCHILEHEEHVMMRPLLVKP